MVIFPPRLVTFPGCLTHTRHHSIKLLFFQILLLGQEHRWYVRKYFYNSGCNAFHRTHNQNSNIYDQRREVCTANMKKFADIEGIANQNEACLVIGPELLFRLKIYGISETYHVRFLALHVMFCSVFVLLSEFNPDSFCILLFFDSILSTTVQY